MCFDDTFNLKQVVKLILCWFGMFFPHPFNLLFDFGSYCLAFGTVRKQFSLESKLVLHHELFSATPCFLQHPRLLQPLSLKSSLSQIPISIQTLALHFYLLPIQQSIRLAPWHLITFALYLNFRSRSCLLAGGPLRAITWGRLLPHKTTSNNFYETRTSLQ